MGVVFVTNHTAIVGVAYHLDLGGAGSFLGTHQRAVLRVGAQLAANEGGQGVCSFSALRFGQACYNGAQVTDSAQSGVAGSGRDSTDLLFQVLVTGFGVD